MLLAPALRRLSVPSVALRALCAGTPSPASAAPTPLARELFRQIEFAGPLSTADLMRACLTHPRHGYYTTSPAHRIFGAAGDFVTSPQISPVFSELLAVWVARFAHTELPRPPAGGAGDAPPFHLVELGPGCGALQRAMLPALRRLRARPAAVALVEASPALAERQRAQLAAVPDAPPLSWHTSLDAALAHLDGAAPAGLPTLFVAHEFFDALPVHVLHRAPAPARRGGGAGGGGERWVEQLVDIDASPDGRAAARLRFVLSRGATPATALLRDAGDGAAAVRPRADERVVEVCPAGLSVAAAMARRIARRGGAALIVDYGDAQRRAGGSLRAIARHGPADLLARPGEADVTADVDFGALARSAASASVAAGEGEGEGEEGRQQVEMRGPVSQRDFLLRLGAAQRFRVLAAGAVERGRRERRDDAATDAELERLQADYERLTGNGEGGMGEVYKVAALVGERTGRLAAVDEYEG